MRSRRLTVVGIASATEAYVVPTEFTAIGVDEDRYKTVLGAIVVYYLHDLW